MVRALVLAKDMGSSPIRTILNIKFPYNKNIIMRKTYYKFNLITTIKYILYYNI